MGKALRWFGYRYHCQLRLSELRHRPRPNVVDQLRASDTWTLARSPEHYRKMVEQSCLLLNISCVLKMVIVSVKTNYTFLVIPLIVDH